MNVSEVNEVRLFNVRINGSKFGKFQETKKKCIYIHVYREIQAKRDFKQLKRRKKLNMRFNETERLNQKQVTRIHKCKYATSTLESMEWIYFFVVLIFRKMEDDQS